MSNSTRAFGNSALKQVAIVQSGESDLGFTTLNDPDGVQSFSPAISRMIKKSDPNICAGDLIEVHSDLSQVDQDAKRRLGALNGEFFELSRLLLPWVMPLTEIPLFQFQKTGVEWLVSRERALLADDMGLGKTVQAIAAIRVLMQSSEATSVLVVAPRSLLYNWFSEFSRWTPEIAVAILSPTKAGSASDWRKQVGRAHVVITSYEQIREFSPEFELNFDIVVADEAHRLRNIDSQQSRGFRSIKSARTWLMSGTPLERDAKDFLTLMSLLYPNQFNLSDRRLDPAVIRARARPYVLRRSKQEVLSELPQVTHVHEFVELSKLQAQEYLSALKWTRGQNPLTRFAKLRSICDQATSNSESSKLDRIVEILSTINEFEENCVVFSFWNEPILELSKRVVERLPDVNLAIYASDLSLSERNDVLTNFRLNGGVLIAGGHIASEGLTLTEANHAIFINRYWNPSINRQAEDRIRRIGQKLPTFVYTFTAPGTIEESIDSMLERKLTDERQFIELLAENFNEY